MTKFKKVLMTLILFSTLVFTSAAPAFASYGATACSGKIWPPVLTGWHIVASQGNSSLDWTFTDPNFHPVTIGIPDLSAQYPDWNQPNNMDIVLWAQNHHYRMPLNNVFYWTAVNPGDTNPNYTGPIPCQYTPAILSIIDASGHTPADFLAAGKAPLTAAAPTPEPVKVATVQASNSTPVVTPKTAPTPTPAPAPATAAAPAPVLAVPQVPIDLEVAQEHSNQVTDPTSMLHATIKKLDDAKLDNEEKAKNDAYNRKFYIILGLIALALVAVGIYMWRELRK